MKTKKPFHLKKLIQPKTLDRPPIFTSRSSDEDLPKGNHPMTDRSCQSCHELREALRTLGELHKKEVKNLTFLLSYKDLALTKRDEMLYEYNRENVELRERIKNLEKQGARGVSKGVVDDQEDEDTFDNRNSLISLTRRQSQKNFPTAKLNSPQNFSQMSLSQKEPFNANPSQNRSPTKRLSRRLSNFIGSTVSLFNTDNHGLLTILMEEGEDPILNHPKVLELEDFLKGSGYLETFNKMSNNTQYELFQTVSVLHAEFKNNINLISRLTKLIKSCQILSTSLILDDALELIVKETCDNLKCDRVFLKGTVFILDEEKSELWSKAANGNKTIRVPLNRGVAGYVCLNNSNLRIDNAYSDPRFNREIDKQTNYYTKTILSVPIKDFNGKVVGVMEAINKRNGLFSADDEGLLTILANQAGLILRNSLMYDKLVLNQYKLLKLVNIGMDLFQCINLEMVMLRAEQKLTDLANIDKCVIYLIDPETDKLVKYEQGNKIKIYESDIGIVGETLKTGCQISTPKPNIDPIYNNKVDLDTQLSLLTIPVKSEEFNKTIAVLQIIDLHASISQSLGKTSSFDMEILNFFIQIFRICVENSLKIKKKMQILSEGEISKGVKKSNL